MKTPHPESSRSDALASPVEHEPVSGPRPRPPWVLPVIVLLLVTGVASAWLAAQRRGPQPQPRITWSENQVEVILSPGETASRNITFTSDRDLQNIVIEPVPELAPFITVQPNTFASVPAGHPQAVTLNYSIPSDSTLGNYEGTIHVRLGNRTRPDTLKVTVRVWNTLSSDTLGVSVRYPPEWLVASTPTGVRLQNYLPPVEETGNGLEGGDIFVEIFVTSLASNANYLERILNSESFAIDGLTAVRGFRATADISPLPGYDAYVPDGEQLLVIAGTYDGTSSSALDLIKAIQDSFHLQQ